VKATSMLPTQRTTYAEMREAEAVRRERFSERRSFAEDRENARIAEIMAKCRQEEMQHATFILSVLHHLDARNPIYLRLEEACEAEGCDWREIVRYPGRCASRKANTMEKRDSVIVRLREMGLSYPEIGTVLNTQHTSVREAYLRKVGA